MGCDERRFRQGFRRRVAALAFSLVALALPVAAQAHPTPTYLEAPGLTRANPVSSPGAFALSGTHGYVIGVSAEPADHAHPARVAIEIVGDEGSASYTAPARLDGGDIHAKFGAFGEVDMRWHPNGRVSKASFDCTTHRAHIYVNEGTYSGHVWIAGENHFTFGTATRISGRTGWYHLGVCTYRVSEGFPGPGILLEGWAFGSHLPKGTYRELSAVQNKPGERVSYSAVMGERRGRLTIFRRAYALGGPKTLVSADHLENGSITPPPPPFSGTGTFERVARRRPGTWRGDLAVDFPGRPGVRLAGENFGAQLKYGFREWGPARQVVSSP